MSRRIERRHRVVEGILATLAWLLLSAPAPAEVDRVELKVIGTWSSFTNYTAFEKPFYAERLPAVSGGRLTARLSAVDDLGLTGFEVMRLLGRGVFDIAHGVFAYVASRSPALEAVDLAGASPDFDHARRLVDAYEPIIARHLDRDFDAHYLMTFRWPSQFIFCTAVIQSLGDLEGKSVRVYGSTLRDFVEGAGGRAVTIAIGEVLPALRRGVVDCAITGSMPAFQAGWHEVVTHVMLLPVGAGLGYVAMSNRRWKQLGEDTRRLLETEYRVLGLRQWSNAEAEDREALSCLSGQAACARANPGKVRLVVPSEEDLRRREHIVREFVLKNWARRCDDACVAEWNETAGRVVGIPASR